MAAPAFPSKADLEAELAAEQAAAAGSSDRVPGRGTAGGSEGEDAGPGELTLIAYSAFMGLSSLLFGGLTLLQARSAAPTSSSSSSSGADDGKPLTVREMFIQGLALILSRVYDQFASCFNFATSIDPQTIVTAVLVLAVVFVVGESLVPTRALRQHIPYSPSYTFTLLPLSLPLPAPAPPLSPSSLLY